MSCVTGTPVTSLRFVSASLEGYQRQGVAGENFPVISVAENSSVSGILFSGLSQLALDRILFYEGDEYQLTSVTVTAGGGAACEASVFLDSGVYVTTGHDWNMAQWQETEKAGFLIRVQNYMQYFGQLTTTEADKYW